MLGSSREYISKFSFRDSFPNHVKNSSSDRLVMKSSNKLSLLKRINVGRLSAGDLHVVGCGPFALVTPKRGHQGGWLLKKW